MSDQQIVLSVRMKADGSGLVGEVVKGERSLDHIGKTGERVGKQINQGATYASDGFKTLRNQILAAFTAAKAFQEIKLAGNTFMSFEALHASIGAVSDNSQEAAERLEFLEKVTDTYGQRLLLLGDNYKKWLGAVEDTNLEGLKSQKVFAAMMETSAALHMSNEQTALSLNALAQMASKSTVSMEELKQQLGDHLPGALNRAAAAMGMATPEFIKLVEEGKILAEDLLPKLAEALHRDFGESALKAANLSRAGINLFMNEVDSLRESFADGFMDEFNESLRDTTELLDSASFQRGIEEFGAWTGDLIGAAPEAARALADLADEAEIALVALTGLLVAKKLGPILNAISANGYKASAALSKLGSDFVFLNKQEKLFAAGAAAATAKTRLFAGAAGVLRTALGAIGGPAGVAMLAGTAIAYFATQSSAAEEQAELLRDSIDDLTRSWEDLGRVALAQGLTDLELRREQIRQEMQDIIFQREHLNTQAGGNQKERTEQVKRLNDTYGDLHDRLKQINQLEEKMEQRLADLRAGRESKNFADELFGKTEAVDPTKAIKVGDGLDDKEWEKRLKKVRDALLDTLPVYEAMRQRADAWRDAMLDGLDKTAIGYEEFKQDVLVAHQHMLEESVKAEEEAAEEKLRASTYWLDGVKRAMLDQREEAADHATFMENMVTKAYQGMGDAVVELRRTGEWNFGRMVDSMIDDLIRFQMQQAMTQAFGNEGGLMSLLNFLPGIGGETAGSTGGEYIDSWRYHNKFADGGVMTEYGPIELKKYARGGIARSPQLAMFGEGSVPEAYVPLQDGRTIPVTLNAQGGGASNVTVNVINETGGEVEQQQRTGPDGEQIIDVFIREAEQKFASDIWDGRGAIAQAIQHRGGVNFASGAS